MVVIVLIACVSDRGARAPGAPLLPPPMLYLSLVVHIGVVVTE